MPAPLPFRHTVDPLVASACPEVHHTQEAVVYFSMLPLVNGKEGDSRDMPVLRG